MYKQLVLADLNKQKLSNNLTECKKRIEELQVKICDVLTSYFPIDDTISFLNFFLNIFLRDISGVIPHEPILIRKYKLEQYTLGNYTCKLHLQATLGNFTCKLHLQTRGGEPEENSMAPAPSLFELMTPATSFFELNGSGSQFFSGSGSFK